MMLLSGPLQKACGAGDGQPHHDPVQPISRDEQRSGRGNPDAQAIEAIHQQAEETSAQQFAKSDDYVGRAVLGGQQVSHPPGRQDSQDKTQRKSEDIHWE